MWTDRQNVFELDEKDYASFISKERKKGSGQHNQKLSINTITILNNSININNTTSTASTTSTICYHITEGKKVGVTLTGRFRLFKVEN